MWNLVAPPGFQGLREDLPLVVYQRHLPHWRQEGATYFVTIRLSDSLPQARLRELRDVRREWERRHPPPRSRDVLEELVRQIGRRVERWLDQSMGSCVLRDRALAEHVAKAMRHFDGDRYELDCYAVMPNHVHALLRPLQHHEYPLERILGSWKQYSTTRINRARPDTRTLWQEESFDRIVRDEEHLFRVIQYIGRNPDNAGLPRHACCLWVKPEWEQLGWTFEPKP